MPYLIGMDEAGYGPNLGPLVVSASMWHVDEDARHGDLYQRLAEVVTAGGGRGDARVAIADSKRVYQSGKGLAVLERGVLAALGLCGPMPSSWNQVWDRLGADDTARRQKLPWYEGYEIRVPMAVDAAEITATAEKLRGGFDRAGVRLVAIRSVVLFPGELNTAIDRYGNKAEALSRATLELAARLLAQCRGEPVSVTCDKHGGRNQYHRLLQQTFPEPLIEIVQEGRESSNYRFGPRAGRVEFRFVAGGESHLPTALASMASKYLRELAMRAFNAFWCRQLPALRPTAGYPVDARRFKADIELRQRQLQIEDRVLWRLR